MIRWINIIGDEANTLIVERATPHYNIKAGNSYSDNIEFDIPVRIFRTLYMTCLLALRNDVWKVNRKELREICGVEVHDLFRITTSFREALGEDCQIFSMGRRNWLSLDVNFLKLNITPIVFYDSELMDLSAGVLKSLTIGYGEEFIRG